MRLLIISHTEHYKNENGQMLGWGPTIREINFLSSYFNEIYHCAPLHDEEAPPSALLYESSNIHYVPLKVSGGRNFKGKLSVMVNARANIKIVKQTLKKVDVFQFRGPTGMGVYLIPFLNYFIKKPGWYKYAGNWVQKNPPLGYAFQRMLMKNYTKRKVTINGKWNKQPKHCFTFENPCLTADELQKGKELLSNKHYNGPFNFCFVGRLEGAKGVGRILDVLKEVGRDKKIGEVHFVGDGEERKQYESIAKELKCETIFHGFQPRNIVGDIMRECHFFWLPSSASEGFPKVIAEAANYGCIPFVSDVSSITQYVIHQENGFVSKKLDTRSLIDDLNTCLEKGDSELHEMAKKANIMAGDFTFQHYVDHVFKDIIK